MSDRDAGYLLGVPVDCKSLDDAIAESLDAVDRRGRPIVFACANPHSLVTAQIDGAFRTALNDASLVVADGVGVTLMARVAGVRIGPRITGTDYFVSVMRALENRGAGSVFFFGSSTEVLTLMSERMRCEFPKIRLAGTFSPPFGPWTDEENAAIVTAINAADPDVLWVGMTAPKQEKWVEENRHRLRAPLIASIGAVFDFYAGTVPRAPRWMCKLGVEWLYRLAKEPRRMWRRNVVSAPTFVALVIWRHVLHSGGA